MDLEKTTQKIIEKTGLSRKEIKEKMDEQISELSGLIDEEGAITIVAKNLGVSVKENQEAANMEKDYKIKDLKPRINASIIGRLIEIEEARTFTRKDGSESTLLPFILKDTSGMIRCIAWGNQHSKIIDETGFVRNEILRVVNGNTKEGRNGVLEIHIGNRSRLQLSPNEVDQKFIPKKITEENTIYTAIDQLSLSIPLFNIKGNLISVFPPKTFTRKNNTKGKRASLNVADQTGNVYLTFWGDHCDKLDNLKAGQFVSITKLQPKQNYQDSSKIDLTATSNTKIKINDKKSSTQIMKTDINDIFNKGGLDNIEGKIQEIDDIKSINMKDGRQVNLLKLVVADETGAIRVALWGDKIIPNLKIGDVLGLNGVFAKLNSYNNQMEGSLTRAGTINILDKEISTTKTLPPSKRVSNKSPITRKKIENITQDDHYEFKGSVIKEINRITTYQACSNCNRKVDNCQCKSPGETVNRMILNLILDDQTSTIRASLIGENAEKFLNEKTDVVTEFKENGNLDEFLKKKNMELVGKEYIFRGKAKFSDYSNNYEINLYFFEELNPEDEAKEIIKLLEKD